MKTVEPCEEKVLATLLSRPWMIVTTAITAATPTTIPTSVRAVRILLTRRLPTATRNDSQSGASRKRRNFLKRVESCTSKTRNGC